MNTSSSIALPGNPRLQTSHWRDTILAGLIVSLLWSAILMAIVYGVFAIQSEESPLLAWKAAMLKPTVIWVALGALLMTIRTVLWVRYRPHASATMESAPRLTIVIPAYNEGALVEKTIESCVAAAYPRDRLQIIAVDDGSSDDTWRYIEKAAGRHPELVTPIRLPANRGKRHALAEGFQRATGEVIVTIDSDSIIERQTLLAITGPFENPKVGAVAGKVLVLNRRQGIVPRMLHVRFIIAFDFLRSVQSTYGMVHCCPGALSAYRAEVVRKLMPAWLNQRFLGGTCTIGEDRALTNDVLAMGYDAVYQRSAIVHTEVPVTYAKLCRMMIRWDRSYVREEIRLFKHVWQRPLGARLFTLYEQTVNNLRFPITYAALGLMVLLVFDEPATLLRLLLAIGVGGTIYTLYYLRTERSRDFLYGILYVYYSFFALTWIFPYALATLRNRRWMTR